MYRFLNGLRVNANGLDMASAETRMGTVTSVDPTNYAVRVMIQPEGVLSGWLPVPTPWIGTAHPPSPGDQVKVSFQEGDAEHGIVEGRLYSTGTLAPTVAGAPAQSGEWLIFHKSGGYIMMANNGHITVKDGAGAKVVLTNDGQMTLEDVSGTTLQFMNNGTLHLLGNLLVTGNISAVGTGTGNMTMAGNLTVSGNTQLGV
jgi:phage baseplate assembly protein gpV